MNKEYKWYKSRLVWYKIFLMVLFLVFVSRLFYLQIIKNEYYSKIADEQYVNKDINIYRRGNIYWTDKTGQYPVLAASDIETNGTNTKGILITKKERFYAFGEVGAKINGFVGYINNGDKKIGQYGLEQYFNNELDRKNILGSKNYFAEVFGNNNILKLINTENNVVEDYGDVYTTIDEGVQNYLYLLLKEIQEKWKSENIGGIVIDPSTGKIIAMDEYPTYNPNNKGSDFSIYINNLISSRYELGSIIKPLTMAAAIDSGSISKDDMYNDVGVRKIDDFDIGNFDRKARGVIPVSKILTDSLNIGIIHIVEKMGIEVFQEYFKKFGLGQETGIALSGEVNSLIGNIETNIKVNNVTAGFGQGIALTPIQVVRALSAIANGGILIDPYIVEKIEYTDGRVSNFPPDDGVRIISKETARAVTDMLVSIVDTKLYHKNNKDTHHSVAIKTGTAQLPKKGGGYLENEYLHSFVGYFPANNPKYLVFLFQKSPKTTAYSSDTLSPAFFKIKNFLVDYYNVPPDR